LNLLGKTAELMLGLCSASDWIKEMVPANGFEPLARESFFDHFLTISPVIKKRFKGI